MIIPPINAISREKLGILIRPPGQRQPPNPSRRRLLIGPEFRRAVKLPTASAAYKAERWADGGQTASPALHCLESSRPLDGYQVVIGEHAERVYGWKSAAVSASASDEIVQTW